ncbi:alpha amylase [Coleofasciculus sp. FACHB-64]|uniref:alpha-amylase family glycosyl hydrolase n=1 Tax=Cyanophyceae TaxID=3028117 RepID=UPI00168733F4|nr:MULTISPECIES: alpha-amylase family glycosyl hydrolase [unclassified Coleofasciculus]MBD1837065.1 alpha amylase [Coleofasciculus sp. FACHB-501]MBD2048632.1 alpha amylase [Coleofasciculus sp. FACHB-64]
MLPDLLHRKQTHFVLWRPGEIQPPPTLYIGNFAGDNPSSFENFQEFDLIQSTDFPELWEIPAENCNLTDGEVYFYWFKVRDTDAYTNTHRILYCTDPTAYTVDRRFSAPKILSEEGMSDLDPASVILYRDKMLVPCDPKGQTADWEGDTIENLQPNNRLVIYELPTRWTRIRSTGGIQEGNGTFRDVVSLFVEEAIAPTFSTVRALQNRAHLVELGVNALELLPPSDSDQTDNWGYGTANYFAADYDLGRPDSQEAPTASTDLINLIKVCHQHGVRFFVDAVMAFSYNNPYRNVNYVEFYIKFNSGDPEQGNRDGFGGDLFKYNYWVEGYHPLAGTRSRFVPAREYMKAYIVHWMDYYRVDGLRLDSVNNIGNYDFLQEFKDYARSLWQEREGSGDKFLVVGEELSVPLALISQNRLDGLWNEKFKHIIRSVILGQNSSDEPSFEWSVRKLIDCRNLGFADGSQAVNYLTSHDVGGFGNERFYSYLNNNQVFDTEKRIKLAFVCLLTAVGIPMILAGDEFADQNDLPTSDDHKKQVDPVNYSRLTDDWRQRIFNYVCRLVKFRTTSDALAVNDTHFIHSDFNEGKRVIVWQRGKDDRLVIVVANFSEYGTPPGSEYKIPNWPATPAGKQWKEIAQDRMVPAEWVGREGIFPWEAKVYALV